MTSPDHPGGGPPWTVRVAMWSARHRWPVFAAWFLATIGLFVASLAMGGTNTQNAVSNDDRAKYEAAHAYDVFNAGGTKDPAEFFYLVISSNSGTLDDSGVAASVQRVVASMADVKAAVGGQQVATFSDIVNPLQAGPQSGLISPDKTSVRVVAHIKGEGQTVEDKLAPVPAFVAQARSATRLPTTRSARSSPRTSMGRCG